MTRAIISPVRSIEQRCRSALSDKCGDKKCDVVLDGKLPTPWALVNMDKTSLKTQNVTRCDYLFIAGTDNRCWVVPIELTSGRNKKSSKMAEQLQAGANFAHRHLHDSIKAIFRPVFVTKGLRKAEQLQARKLVKFRGQSEAPEVISCGDPLSKALT